MIFLPEMNLRLSGHRQRQAFSVRLFVRVVTIGPRTSVRAWQVAPRSPLSPRVERLPVGGSSWFGRHELREMGSWCETSCGRASWSGVDVAVAAASVVMGAFRGSSDGTITTIAASSGTFGRPRVATAF